MTKCKRLVSLIRMILTSGAGAVVTFAVVTFELLAMKPNCEATFQALD
jgi:hypothetical protein